MHRISSSRRTPGSAAHRSSPSRRSASPDPEPPRHTSAEPGDRDLVGTVALRRLRWWRYPVYSLVHGDTVVAHLGRSGWLRTFFGRGQRIGLSSGERWRLRSVTVGRTLAPVIVDANRAKVAMSGFSGGAYGITTRDTGYVLMRTARRRQRRWILREHEDEIAILTTRPTAIHAERPVPIGAILLAFHLARYGIVGEHDTGIPKFSWGRP